jgi:putative ATP-dependent endonuclease of OLD family
MICTFWFQDTFLVKFAWRYIPAIRGASVNQVEGPNSALQTLLRAIDLGPERAELAGLLDGFNDKLAASMAIGQLRDAAAAHLSRALPRVVERDDLAVRTAADPDENVLAGVSMFFKRGDDHVPLTELSDGLRQLVSCIDDPVRLGRGRCECRRH